MCQGCVKRGEMTQQELDEAMLAGDLTVVPVCDLEPSQYERLMADKVNEAIDKGVPPLEVFDWLIGEVRDYVLARHAHGLPTSL